MNLRKSKYIVFSLGASLTLLIGLLLLLSGTPQIASAAPTNLFVSTGGTGTDCTQPNPCVLATALNQSSDGDTIYVAQGTYTSTDGAVLTVTKSITIYGGWDALTTTLPMRDPLIYSTILDGENARRGVEISGDITPTLDGFIITRGNASNAAIAPGYGGGIYSSDANPIISNNVITDNIASTTASNWGQGGGIFIQFSNSATIRNNLIANNWACPNYRGKGGGLQVAGSSGIDISNNIFHSNVAGATNNDMGGGLSLDDSSAIIHGNLIQENWASQSGDGRGGGFYSQAGDITLNGNTITSNRAEYGSVTFEYNPNVTVTNNIIAQNSGGGVFVRANTSLPLAGTLAHNTFVENDREAVYVGYLNSGYSTLSLTNNIIVSHTTGIFAYPGINPNIIIADHTLFYDNNYDIAGATITSTDVITGSNPLFIKPSAGNYHLWPDSPAIDSGADLPWLATDIDGDTRPFPTGGFYDIGADEASWFELSLPVVMKIE